MLTLLAQLVGCENQEVSESVAIRTPEDQELQGAEARAVFDLQSTLAFTSNRQESTLPATQIARLLAGEVYLADPEVSDVRRLTNNSDFDGFPKLSPDGKKIAYEHATLQSPCRTVTNPSGAGSCVNVSDVMVMASDGNEPSLVVHGAAVAWSPDGKSIAFHASASGTGLPLRADPGSATVDSDLFVIDVDDAIAGQAMPTNVTNSAGVVDEDADWSPNGDKLVYTRHDSTDNPQQSNTAEIYTINLDGTGETRLTFNGVEERAPAWSPDGTRIAYMCRIGGGTSDFEICVMNADGSGILQVTDNSMLDATPAWSPGGHNELVIHRVAGVFQLVRLDLDAELPTAGVPLTPTTSDHGFPSWGKLRVRTAP